MLLVAETNAAPADSADIQQDLPDDLVLHFLQRYDFVAQAQLSFDRAPVDLSALVRRPPEENLMNAFFNLITPDPILDQLITILCGESRYNTVLLTLFRKATDQLIVGLYDRLQNMTQAPINVEKLYATVDDAKFRQLIDAIRWDAWSTLRPLRPTISNLSFRSFRQGSCSGRPLRPILTICFVSSRARSSNGQNDICLIKRIQTRLGAGC